MVRGSEAVPQVIVKTVLWFIAPVESVPGNVLTVAGKPASVGTEVIVQEAGGFVTVQESSEESPLRTRLGVARKEDMVGAGTQPLPSQS